MKKFIILPIIFLILILSGCVNKYSTEQVNNLLQQEREKNNLAITNLQNQINELKKNTSDNLAPIDYGTWQEYSNDCFEFQYPSNWVLLADDKCSGVSIVHKGDQINKEIIDFQVDKYTQTNSLENGQYERSIGKNYTSYYHLGQTPAGYVPIIYLVKDKNIIIASYNIQTSSTTTAELELKKITATFRFLK